MGIVRSFAVVGQRLARYVWYRLGWGPAPDLMDFYPEVMDVIGQIVRWRRRLRIVHPERCPAQGPAVFVGNHLRADDPLYLFRSVYLASGKRLFIHYMMRKGFFARFPCQKLMAYDELMERWGAFLIERDRITLSQMKPFVKVLVEGRAFGMFPGGTRSRSGLFFEYRDGHDGPGGVSFFVAQAQRGEGRIPVPVVPMVRTWNPATGMTAVVFGEAIYLPPGADRVAQRACDFRIAETMGSCVEVNAAQLAAGLLYLHCLHGRGDTVPAAALEAAVREAVGRLSPGRLIEPDTVERTDRAVEAALALFARARLVRRGATSVTCHRAAILAVPRPGESYVKQNPVKYLVNQVLHLPDVVAALEETPLG